MSGKFHAPVILPLREDTPVSIKLRSDRAAQPVWTW